MDTLKESMPLVTQLVFNLRVFRHHFVFATFRPSTVSTIVDRVLPHRPLRLKSYFCWNGH
jgi:hypothetical protein